MRKPEDRGQKVSNAEFGMRNAELKEKSKDTHERQRRSELGIGNAETRELRPENQSFYRESSIEYQVLTPSNPQPEDPSSPLGFDAAGPSS